MNRRRFFQMAAGILGALALPVPKVRESILLGHRTYVTPGFYAVKDWRHAVRYAKIDISDLVGDVRGDLSDAIRRMNSRVRREQA